MLYSNRCGFAMDRNIFEVAANKAKKHAPPSSKKEAADSTALNKQANDSNADRAKDSEIAEMFTRMHEIRNDLESQLKEIRKKGEEIKFDVDAYLEKTTNFRPSDVEKNIQDQKALQDQVNAICPPEACIQKLKKNADKLTQERKSKSLGSRKNWIPTR